MQLLVNRSKWHGIVIAAILASSFPAMSAFGQGNVRYPLFDDVPTKKTGSPPAVSTPTRLQHRTMLNPTQLGEQNASRALRPPANQTNPSSPPFKTNRIAPPPSANSNPTLRSGAHYPLHEVGGTRPVESRPIPRMTAPMMQTKMQPAVAQPERAQPVDQRPMVSTPASFRRMPTLESSIEPFSDELGVEDPDLTWWKNLVNHPISEGNQSNPVDTNSLVFEALKNSPRIQAISQNPLIREQQVVEADSDFDALSFVRTQFEDRNDPVGNTLTTGGAPFLEDHIWFGEFGLRKKLRTGASVELSERLGFHNSNSSFFVPQDQGTATLALNMTQPLLRGRGKYYNESQILIAQAAGGAAWDTFINELQDELQQVAESYWKLYYNRSIYLQKEKNVQRGEQILRMLEGRSALDSLPSQITRARSAVISRKTDLANARRDVRDSATEIRRRIADRNWMANQTVEMLPVEPATAQPLDLELEQVVFTALENRNEIKETLKRAKIAGIQERISVNELLPELSVLLGTYVSALRGDTDIFGSFADQFGEVKPGYSVGFEFEFPLRNRAARSRLSQRKLQLTKIRAEVDESIQNVIAESQVALRRVGSALETLDAAYQSIEAARADLDQNYGRWEAFALVEGDIADGQTPTTILDQLLDSQERLTAAELIYAQAELELKTAEIGLQRTMGTLLMRRNVTFGKADGGDRPRMILEQNDEPVPNSTPVGQFPTDMMSELPFAQTDDLDETTRVEADASEPPTTTVNKEGNDNDFRPNDYYNPSQGVRDSQPVEGGRNDNDFVPVSRQTTIQPVNENDFIPQIK